MSSSRFRLSCFQCSALPSSPQTCSLSGCGETESTLSLGRRAVVSFLPSVRQPSCWCSISYTVCISLYMALSPPRHWPPMPPGASHPTAFSGLVHELAFLSLSEWIQLCQFTCLHLSGRLTFYAFHVHCHLLFCSFWLFISFGFYSDFNVF